MISVLSVDSENVNNVHPQSVSQFHCISAVKYVFATVQMHCDTDLS